MRFKRGCVLRGHPTRLLAGRLPHPLQPAEEELASRPPVLGASRWHGLSHLSLPGLLIRDEDPGSIPADWSPDGSQIAFVAFRKTDKHPRTSLYVVNTDGPRCTSRPSVWALATGRGGHLMASGSRSALRLTGRGSALVPRSGSWIPTEPIFSSSPTPSTANSPSFRCGHRTAPSLCSKARGTCGS